MAGLDTQAEAGGAMDGVSAARDWTARAGTAPLPAADAADLVAGALAVMDAAARAAGTLDWLTGDTFVDALRRAERSHDD